MIGLPLGFASPLVLLGLLSLPVLWYLLRLTPPRPITLESALEFIDGDELVEVTPESIRLRKRLLSQHERRREAGKAEDLRRAAERDQVATG